ncbi:uncharacterized protein K441DRAFT_657423 [Cenococcum geophilum 1.58]|uniref:uncharacterized protein n=1 Tax=Cenococcum geophilum 1.58 TaxID=794803 RepID=UPI00358EE8E6|nr:hypothetical protein K441DRAFT_657423 [Cenococcum geophilum 1.58]
MVEEDPDRFRTFENLLRDLDLKCRGHFKNLRVIDARDFHEEYFNGTEIFAQTRDLLEEVAGRLKNLGVTLLHAEFPEGYRHSWLSDYEDEDEEDNEVENEDGGDEETFDSDNREEAILDAGEDAEDSDEVDD